MNGKFNVNGEKLISKIVFPFVHTFEIPEVDGISPLSSSNYHNIR